METQAWLGGWPVTTGPSPTDRNQALRLGKTGAQTVLGGPPHLTPYFIPSPAHRSTPKPQACTVSSTRLFLPVIPGLRVGGGSPDYLAWEQAEMWVRSQAPRRIEPEAALTTAER